MPRLNDLLKDRDKHWLEGVFDQYERNQQREPYVRTHFSPSQAHLCPRALYYYMLGYEVDPISDNSLRRMAVGTTFHEFIEKRLTDAGVLVSAEQEITYDDPPIRGFYDAIIKRPSDDKEFLLELKSMAAPKFKKDYQGEDLPRQDHLMQWNLYSLMTGINDGMIFYINKNTQDYYIKEITRNDDIIEQVLNKFKLVQEHLANEEIVPYQPDWKHDWCNYRATCEKDYYGYSK